MKPLTATSLTSIAGKLLMTEAVKVKFCLAYLCLGCLVFPSATLAKQAVTNSLANSHPWRIGNIQNTKRIQGAGCSLQRKGSKGYVFWSPFGEIGLMNIDGKDRVLKFVSETPSMQDSIKKGGRIEKGDRSTVIYKYGKINVRIDRVATRVCRQGDQECESTSYDGKLKLTTGDRQQVIAVEGECGS
jgi:hypothetical protein